VVLTTNSKPSEKYQSRPTTNSWIFPLGIRIRLTRGLYLATHMKGGRK
jgi:hypothetical protein